MPDPDPASRKKEKEKPLDSRVRGNDGWGRSTVMLGFDLASKKTKDAIRHAGPRSGIQTSSC